MHFNMSRGGKSILCGFKPPQQPHQAAAWGCGLAVGQGVHDEVGKVNQFIQVMLNHVCHDAQVNLVYWCTSTFRKPTMFLRC